MHAFLSQKMPYRMLTTFAVAAMLLGLLAGCNDDGTSSAGGSAGSQHGIELDRDRVGPVPIDNEKMLILRPQPRQLNITELMSDGRVWSGPVDEQDRAHGQWVRADVHGQPGTFWWHGKRVSKREWHRRNGSANLLDTDK